MSEGAFTYPQRMGRIIMQAMEEVIGRRGTEQVLEAASLTAWSAHPAQPDPQSPLAFESISRLHVALEQIYGAPGGRGLALRIGRACFTYGLREYAALLKLSETAFRLLPLETKLHVSARSLADLFNKHSDQRVRLEEAEEILYWHIERCPLCWGRQAGQPVCHMAVGLLQESLYWLSGGKIFNVEETHCIARGDPVCTITIHKQPIS